jgi:hypothetical protein
MVCLTAKGAWRQFRSEQLVEIGYSGFCKWVKKLGIELDPGIDTDALAVLRNYAKVKSEAPDWRTHQNGQQKLAVLRAIAQKKAWTGSALVDLVELHGACSRATLYRRSEVVLGGKFSALQEYTAEQARKLIFGI